jgi:hypothetical protein
MEDVMKLTDKKFASLNKNCGPLRCSYITNIEVQHIAAEGLLNEGQEMFMRVYNKNSDGDGSLDMNEDGDNGAGEHGAELHRISCVAPLNMIIDINQ